MRQPESIYVDKVSETLEERYRASVGDDWRIYAIGAMQAFLGAAIRELQEADPARAKVVMDRLLSVAKSAGL